MSLALPKPSLLERRAQRLRISPAPKAEEAMALVASFEYGGHPCLLPLSQVKACLRLSAVSPLPLTPPSVAGVFRHQGETLCLYSLPSLLQEGGWSQDPKVMLVVELSDRMRLGLDCEQAPRRAQVPQAALDAATAAPGNALVSMGSSDGSRLLRLGRLPIPRVGQPSRKEGPHG